MTQLNLRAFGTADDQVAPADHVLAHIVNPNAGPHHLDADRIERLHYAQRIGHLRRQRSSGRGDHLRGFPGGIVEAGAVPTGELAAGIVLFAIVFVVGENWAVSGKLPLRAGDDRGDRAILIFDIEP